MKLKQRPEDFSVKESFRFEEVPNGPFRVYLLDKQKLTTFDAVARVRERFGLRPGSITYCGLKDRQGRTEQLIAVEGFDVDVQDEDLRLKYLGRSDRPLSGANIVSNRFSITVRDLAPADVGQVQLAVAEVNRLGVVNYFDSQRFGSLKHGQGFIAKDLLRGDFEAALRNYLAKPSPLDRTHDAKVKAFWQRHWGEWTRRVPFEGARKYHRILESLRRKPNDFVTAFLQIDSDYRALHLFAYQSYLWNEGVRRLLQLLLPREHLFPMAYQAGTLLFHREADAAALGYLRRLAFPLLGPTTKLVDPKVKEAVEWVLGKERLSLDALVIKEAPRLLFFKHQERPVLVYPHKLVIGRAQRDELNADRQKMNVAFTLPPGSYATLVTKRLFHFSWREDSDEEILATQRPALVTDDDGAREQPRHEAGRSNQDSRRRDGNAPNERPTGRLAPAAPRSGNRLDKRSTSGPKRDRKRPERAGKWSKTRGFGGGRRSRQ